VRTLCSNIGVVGLRHWSLAFLWVTRTVDVGLSPHGLAALAERVVYAKGTHEPSDPFTELATTISTSRCGIVLSNNRNALHTHNGFAPCDREVQIHRLPPCVTRTPEKHIDARIAANRGGANFS
jgi:hypothetical protein